jgi:hypothetical protein
MAASILFGNYSVEIYLGLKSLKLCTNEQYILKQFYTLLYSSDINYSFRIALLILFIKPGPSYIKPV